MTHEDLLQPRVVFRMIPLQPADFGHVLVGEALQACQSSFPLQCSISLLGRVCCFGLGWIWTLPPADVDIESYVLLMPQGPNCPYNNSRYY
jgi:hypothetical protein